MSTIGFTGSTPADGATLTLGVAYVFRIAFITDTNGGDMSTCEPVITAGSATRLPDDSQGIGDSGDPAPDFADWTVTPTATGPLTITAASDILEIDGGAGRGERSYTVAEQRKGNPAILSAFGFGFGM